MFFIAQDPTIVCLTYVATYLALFIFSLNIAFFNNLGLEAIDSNGFEKATP
jgi:hypothetical protein